MTDAAAPSDPIQMAEPAKDSKSQAVIAFTIVLCVTAIALSLVLVIWLNKDATDASEFTIIGTICGGLMTALNAPSGIGNVIAAAVKKQPAQGQG